MEVPYVNEKAALLVRELEGKFRALSSSVGVIFISINATPVEGGASHEFFIRLGLSKKLSRDAGEALIQSVLRVELAAGLKVRSDVHLGVSGAAYDDSSDERAHQAPA